MRPRVDVPQHLLALAASQAGVLTTDQLSQLSLGSFPRVRGEWTWLSLVAVASRALSERRTNPSRLLAALSSRERVRHRFVMQELCGVAGQGIESVLEWRYEDRVATVPGLSNIAVRKVLVVAHISHT